MSEATAEKRTLVNFVDVPRSYAPGENLVVIYQWDADSLTTTTRDWIGLFRVGWTSSRDYYTFEWAQQPQADENRSSVTFAGRRLPPEDSHFYQLCYVNREGKVLGVSVPFQFSAPGTSLGPLDDLELVEVGEGELSSLMVLQRRLSKAEEERLRKDYEQSQVELSSMRSSACELKTEKESLSGRVRALETERAKFKQLADENGVRAQESESKVVELEHQLREARESERQLKESERQLKEALEREEAHSANLLAVKSEEERQVEGMSRRIAELTAENEDFHRQVQIKESQVEDLQQLVADRGQESERLMATLAENEQEITVLREEKAALENLKEEIETLRAESGVVKAEIATLNTENVSLKQDIAVAQENVSELMGERGMLHHAPPPDGTVDRSAYEALQQAFETMEGYFLKSKQETDRVCAQLQESQEVVQTLQGKCDELVERLNRAQQEFEGKAAECVELRKQLRLSGTAPEDESEIGHLKQRMLELEKQEEQLVESCEAAVKELSARNEERKQFQVQLESMTTELERLRNEYQQNSTTASEELARSQMKLEQANFELQQFQDKSDKKIHGKNEQLQKQQAVLEARKSEIQGLQQELARVKKENGRLQHNVDQLKDHLERMKASVKSEGSARTCPICETKFPGRMDQAEFERHVQSHFET